MNVSRGNPACVKPSHTRTVIGSDGFKRCMDCKAEYARTYKRSDPEKEAARKRVRKAVATGKFKKLDCQKCQSAETEFHHTDGYDRENWFTGMWLCRPCHVRVHKELRAHPIPSKI